MPASPSYPGVYIQELPSGVRTITGVATSITAFVGRALFGPVNDPVTINNYGDFERKFGGLWASSTMSYSVQQFFQAGGGQAIIVRVLDTTDAGTGGSAAKAVKALTATPRLTLVQGAATGTWSASITSPTATTFVLTIDVSSTTPVVAITVTCDPLAATGGVIYVGDLSAYLQSQNLGTATEVPWAPPTAAALAPYVGTAGATTLSFEGTSSTLSLRAANEGAWGNYLRATVDYDTADSTDIRLFNLTVDKVDDDGEPVLTEVFRNVSLDSTHARYLVTVLEEESNLVETWSTLPSTASGTSARPRLATSAAFASGSDGVDITILDITGTLGTKTGMYALEKADLFNILCLPPPTFSTPIGDWEDAIAYCENKRAFLIVDSPNWVDKDAAMDGMAASDLATLGITASPNAAMFFPWVKIADPLRENRPRAFVPCGVVAGVIARTDTQRGIWKAPAGLDARLRPVRSLSVNLTDAETGDLNPLGLNCLRTMPAVGNVVWGARTLEGNDRLGSEWKYIPVRRLALFIEETLYRGTQWVVFEPNDEPLWSQIRLNITSFMHGLFRKGAFQGSSPREAYFVKCDSETTTQDDIDRGIVNIIVGFAPLKPAEFVIISLKQIAGQSVS